MTVLLLCTILAHLHVHVAAFDGVVSRIEKSGHALLLISTSKLILRQIERVLHVTIGHLHTLRRLPTHGGTHRSMCLHMVHVRAARDRLGLETLQSLTLHVEGDISLID